MNPFEALAALGYARTVPIIPPDATISPKSSLAQRVGTHQDARGKTPGIRWPDGSWSGYDWLQHEADERDYRRWHAMGAGVGIRTGGATYLTAIDADTLDEALAARIGAEIEATFGTLPTRIGRAPKALYLLRTDGLVPYQRVDFGEPDARGIPERVEVLSEGRQFVAQGIHPKTGQPYRWTAPLPPLHTLPVVPAAAIAAFLERLREILPRATVKAGGAGTGTEVDQASLRGDPALIRKAVAAIPNTSAHFPTREDYLALGYAIRAAVEDEAGAYEIWAEWCDRWDGGDNDPEIMQADWRRMKGPYRRGASWLYGLAESMGGGAFSQAEVYFDELPESTNPFSETGLNAFSEERPAIHATPYAFPEPTAIQPRQWIYGTHLIRKFLSTTVAPSGLGKSSLVLVEALALASGKPLLGIQPHGQFKVWLWNGEDPRDELERRIAAAMKHHGLTREDIGDRLFLDSGREMDIILASETRGGCVISAPVVGALIETIQRNGIDATIIDPFVSSHRVTENDNGSIDLVTKQWAKIFDVTNSAGEMVHHVRKLNGAEITVEDSRGAVSLIATSRSARALTKMTKAEASKLGLADGGVWRRLFRFGDSKNNLAPPADLETSWMQLVNTPLGNGSGDALDAIRTGDQVGVVAVYDGVIEAAAALHDATERDLVLAAIRSGDGNWRSDARSPAWVGHAIAGGLSLDMTDDAGKARAKAVVASLLKDGVIRIVTRLDNKSMPRQYVEICPDKVSETDVFG
jgi:hypothetical protein